MDSRRDRTLAVVIALAWAAGVILWQWGGIHYDLNAIYVAGHFLAQGRPDLIYAVDLDSFPLTSHPEWIALNDRWGCVGFCAYPYVYPPVWAALVAPLTGVLDMHGFSNAVLVVQVLLFSATPILAWRLWRPRMGRAKWVFRCLFLATTCTMGTIAFVNNQPQLLVTFLMVLAFERAAHGRPWLGGLALGLAASIKIYPAVLGLLWLREGNWRALAGACIGGGAVVALNFAVVPWPLQEVFLAQASAISAGVFPAAWNYGLVSVLGHLDPRAFEEGVGVVALGAWHAASGPALLLVGLALLARLSFARDADWRRRFLLPALIALLTAASPIGWSYYLFIPLFALQLLPDIYGRRGLFLMLAIASLVFVPFYVFAWDLMQHTAAHAVLGLCFALSCFAAMVTVPAAGPALGAQRPVYRPLPSTA